METHSSQSEAAEPSDKSITEPAVLLMKAHLPPYIVNCFLASGYDTFSVISDMDTSDNPGNSLQGMEDFINEQYPDDPLYLHSGKVCKFPPGHRIRIKKFVELVKEKSKLSQQSKRKLSFQNAKSKRVKQGDDSTCDSSAGELSCGLDQFNVVSDVRKHLAKWQRSSHNHKIRALKENEHFTISARMSGNQVTVNIECKLCGKKPTLSVKGGKVLISNWTCHITSCIMEVPKKQNSKTLDKYFTPSPVTSPSSEFASSLDSSPNSSASETSSSYDTENPDLHFQLPPSVNIHDTQEGDMEVVKVHTDWSRTTRERLKILKCASDPYPAKLTTYFEVSAWNVCV